jgi:hypothetical protein
MTTANKNAARILFGGATFALLAAAGCGVFLGDLDGAHLADAGSSTSQSCVACGRRDGGMDGAGESRSTSGSTSESSSGGGHESGTPSTQPESSTQSSATPASSNKSSPTTTAPSSSEPHGSSASSSSSDTTVSSASSTATSSSTASDGGVDAGESPFEWDNWLIPNDPSDVAAGAPNPESYTSNGDGTVTDNVTGLMWQQATGQDGITFTQAVSYCSGLSLAGHTDWRLPTIMELVSLLDFDDQTLMDSTAFNTASATSLWSSTLVAFEASSAWYVDLEADSDEGNGVVQAYSFDSGMNALCVR